MSICPCRHSAAESEAFGTLIRTRSTATTGSSCATSFTPATSSSVKLNRRALSNVAERPIRSKIGWDRRSRTINVIGSLSKNTVRRLRMTKTIEPSTKYLNVELLKRGIKALTTFRCRCTLPTTHGCTMGCTDSTGHILRSIHPSPCIGFLAPLKDEDHTHMLDRINTFGESPKFLIQSSSFSQTSSRLCVICRVLSIFLSTISLLNVR